MTIQSTHTRKFQWKWVGITIGAYFVVYVLPILIAGGAFSSNVQGHTADVFIGIWSFAGIITIAALVGYFSEGFALWEPVVAALFLATVALPIRAVQRQISHSPFGYTLSLDLIIKQLIIPLAIVFVLSLLGSGLGRALGEHRNSEGQKPPEST